MTAGFKHINIHQEYLRQPHAEEYLSVSFHLVLGETVSVGAYSYWKSHLL